MSLIFNMLSMLVITFLPRSKRLLNSWLQSPSAVIWEPPKIKFDTVSITSWQIHGEKLEAVTGLIFLVSKSLQMVIVAMKLKDTSS